MMDAIREGRFAALGRLIYKRRRIVLAIWLVLFAGFGLLAQKTPGLLKDNGFTPVGSGSDLGLERLRDDLGYPPST